MQTGRKGKFIVIDGLDGSGKATQTRMLAERLAKEGMACEKTDFPNYAENFFGAFIGECLAGKHGDFVHADPRIISPLYANDRKESTPRIEAWLAEGKVVLADRYASANQIHQGGKIADEAERAELIKWLAKMEYEIVGIARPDIVLYLRVSPETTLKLMTEKRAKNSALAEAKDQHESDRAFVDNSYACANWLAKTQPEWSAIDCMDGDTLRTPEAIHEEVYAAVKSLITPMV